MKVLGGVELKDGDCETCDGCGYVANDSDAIPWKEWAALPRQSAVAVHMGLVQPIFCPTCTGTGDQPC